MAINAQQPDFDFAAKGNVTPVQSLSATVPREQYEELFGAIEDFAGANGFKYRIAHFDADPELFSIDVWRKNALISGNKWSGDLAFEFFIYIALEAGGTEEMAAVLRTGFASAMAQVPGTTIGAE